MDVDEGTPSPVTTPQQPEHQLPSAPQQSIEGEEEKQQKEEEEKDTTLPFLPTNTDPFKNTSESHGTSHCQLPISTSLSDIDPDENIFNNILKKSSTNI
jgi:hypothetical protein